MNDWGFVGDCAACDGQMVEETLLDSEEERQVRFRCQDCDATAELRYQFDDGLEGGSWSGVANPRIEDLSWIDCPRCHGYGEIEDPICDLRRAMNGREHACPTCNGSGSVGRVVETEKGDKSDGGSN